MSKTKEKTDAEIRQLPTKIRKVEFAPPLSIPIPEFMKALLLEKKAHLKAAQEKEGKAASLELEAKHLRQQAQAEHQKAITEGNMIVEVILASNDLKGKPHQLMPELDMVVVDPN